MSEDLGDYEHEALEYHMDPNDTLVKVHGRKKNGYSKCTVRRRARIRKLNNKENEIFGAMLVG